MQPGARGTLWWRALAWLVLSIVFTATHWPNLQLDLPMRGSDKVLHAVAFMMLALVWWPTGFVRSVPLFALAAASWSILDEALQALPFVHRHAGVEDAVANLCGIAIATLVIVALQRDPRAPGHAVRALAWRMVIDRPQAWMACAASSALGAMAGGVILVTAQSLLRQPIKPMHSALIGATLGVAVALHATIVVMMRSMEARLRAQRCCPACGAPGADGPACAACGAAVPGSSWVVPIARTLGGVPDRHWLRVGLVPVGIAGIVLVLVMSASIALSIRRIEALQPYLGPEVDPGMRLVLDAVALAMAASAGLWWSRRAARRIREKEAIECMACGHDLRGVVPESGIGRCSECAEPFRIPIEDPVRREG
jgi:VanZ family protein